MDEAVKEIDQGFPIEDIDDTSLLYRTITIMATTKGSDKRRFPNEGAFALRPHETGLSLNWSKYCCENKSLIVKGLTKSLRDPFNFIDVSPNIVFNFPSNFLKSYGELKHTPIYLGNPSPVGLPNNISHSELTPYEELKMRMDLADYCNQNHASSFCKTNMSDLKLEIENLRQRLNDTPYHRDWIF